MFSTKKHQAREAVPAGRVRVTLKAWVPPAHLAQAATTAVQGWTYRGCTTHLYPCSASLSFEALAAAGAAHEAIAERALAALKVAVGGAYTRVVMWVESGYLRTEHEQRAM